MTWFQGADTEQLREHAELMRDRANSLDGLRTRLSMLVAHGAEWEGPDAEAFRERWRSEVAPRFDAQIGALEDRGSSLEQEAEEQDTASEVEKSPSLFENLRDLSKIGQGLFKHVTTFRKLIEDFPAHMKEWKAAFKGGPGELWAKYKDELVKGMKKGLNFGEEYSSIAKKLVGELGFPDSLGTWDPLKKHLDGGKFPSWLGDVAPKAATLGKLGGKLIPGFDIGVGIHQMTTGETTFDKVSGGLSAVGGGMVLAAPLFGPAAPVVAGIGAAAGVVSLGMDLGKMAWENREAIGAFVGDVAGGVTHAVSNVADGVADVASNVAGGVADAASNAAETIGNGVEAAGDAVKNVGGAIGDALGFG